MAFIYGLVDPVAEADIRYVGKTVRTLQVRLRHHLKPQQVGLPGRRGSWLRKVLREGRRPRIVLLAEVPDCDQDCAERSWIARLRASGARLTNMTDGGTGGATRCGHHITKEHLEALQAGRRRFVEEGLMPKIVIGPLHRQRISEAMKGKPKSSAARAAMSKAKSGKPWSLLRRAAYDAKRGTQS